MSSTIPELIGLQFGAALDMLENAINACPDAQWTNHSKFWYLAYHTAFWTDYYLSDTPLEKDYHPPPPSHSPNSKTAKCRHGYTIKRRSWICFSMSAATSSTTPPN